MTGPTVAVLSGMAASAPHSVHNPDLSVLSLVIISHKTVHNLLSRGSGAKQGESAFPIREIAFRLGSDCAYVHFGRRNGSTDCKTP